MKTYFAEVPYSDTRSVCPASCILPTKGLYYKALAPFVTMSVCPFIFLPICFAANLDHVP